jgi:hypothetical protein
MYQKMKKIGAVTELIIYLMSTSYASFLFPIIVPVISHKTMSNLPL